MLKTLKTFIQTKIGYSLLKKRSASVYRNKMFSNFSSAKTLAVIFDASNVDESTNVRLLSKFCIENKLKFRALGFIKSFEQTEQFTLYTGLSYFSEKDFNLSGLPISGELNDFLETPFDILIDLHRKPIYFLDVILALSHAKMKLGIKQNDKGFYDFMIDIDNNNLDYFVEQIKHYLNIIKT